METAVAVAVVDFYLGGKFRGRAGGEVQLRGRKGGREGWMDG